MGGNGEDGRSFVKGCLLINPAMEQGGGGSEGCVLSKSFVEVRPVVFFLRQPLMTLQPPEPTSGPCQFPRQFLAPPFRLSSPGLPFSLRFCCAIFWGVLWVCSGGSPTAMVFGFLDPGPFP